MAKKLRRYRPSGLPKLTRESVQMCNALLWRLSSTPFQSGFKERLRDALEPVVHTDVDVWFEGVADVERGRLGVTLTEPLCAAVIALTPRVEKALIEIDLGIAQMCIDKILGGTPEHVDAHRPLTEIEEGVFSFVLLRVLQLLQAEAGDETGVSLKFEGIKNSFAALKERFDVDESLVVLTFKLFFDVKVGFCRVYLPRSFVGEWLPREAPAAGPARQRMLTRMAERVDLVRAIRAPLSVEVGRLSFALNDLRALEVDDIVLLEETDARLEPGDTDALVLTGRVRCRVGLGSAATIDGSLIVADSGRYALHVDGIAPVGEPRLPEFLWPEPPPADEDRGGEACAVWPPPTHGTVSRVRAAQRAQLHGLHVSAPRLTRANVDDEDCDGENMNDEMDEGAAQLLDDVTVPMVVELGRVTVSAADVLALRAGQVIELSQKPGSAVDLVVDGKRIGKGELVEVDGELGVRILSLAR